MIFKGKVEQGGWFKIKAKRERRIKYDFVNTIGGDWKKIIENKKKIFTKLSEVRKRIKMSEVEGKMNL